MWTVALAQLRTQPRRYVSVVLAVLIGTMFLAAASLVASSAQATLRATLGATYAGADLVVLPDDGGDASGETAASAMDRLPSLAGTADAPGPLAGVPGVAEAFAPTLTWAEVAAGGEPRAGVAVPLPQDASLAGVRVLEGTLPAPGDARAVALDEGTAETLAVGVGDTVTLTAGSGQGAVEAVVSGLTSVSPDPMLSSQAQVWGGAGVVDALQMPEAAPFATAALLRLEDRADPQSVRADVAELLRGEGVAAAVATPDEASRDQLSRMAGGTDLFGWVLGGFAVLALVVTALVIANTFQVLVAQRTRDLALLRTVGASVRQIRGAVLLEALLTGLLGALLGVGLAVALTAGVVAVARQALGVPALSFGGDPLQLAAVAAVGTGVAVVAALGPARAATRVAPLQALRPAAETEVLSRAGLVRAVVGAVLAVGGAVLMWSGALGQQFLPAVGGGVLSFLGMLLLARLFVPTAVRGAAVLARPAGVPGRLAGLNATRHRSRTAATAAALLIGTTLVALVLTGGRTAQAETDRLLDTEFPVDLVVSVAPGQDPAAAARAVAEVAGVSAAAGSVPVGATVNGTPAYAVAADGLRAVVAREPERDAGALAADGTVYVPSWADPTTGVTVDGRTQDLRSVRGSGLQTAVLLTPETAEQVRAEGRPAVGADGGDGAGSGAGPGPEGGGLVLVDAGGDAAVRDLQDLAEGVTAAAGDGAQVVEGGLGERALYSQVIDALLGIVVALLAVSVLIALIGVANTLSLSVIERTRENALLRALGLTRRGLRGMIAVEAVLIAAVAAALGCALGVFYGWAGSQLILGELVAQVTGTAGLVWPAVPWVELLLIVAVAALAGLVASLLPARRAARLSPVEGLATV
ncbi:FtsX-like permease family protein [Micrococcus lacusdianchii]|uniref:FtsX-like permease family protein n=1 Tax=Micrococcus lacusdianchii TaxID=2915940 RepID=UPI002005FA50|nr:ABC transporter permease [Micrococcus sp. JXJ CY 30]